MDGLSTSKQMTKQLVVTLLGGLPLGFRLSALKEDERFYAVSKIRQHSKAEKSGLQLGDIILCVNGISCDGLSHVAVTSLTDISDVLNLLVLRNAQAPSDVVAAFSSLGQSARRLTQKEISDLTGNQSLLTVTRRQSTGCISQGPHSDQHKQTQVKLFGSHKLRQNIFTNLARTSQRERYRSDSEEKKFEETDKISGKRREKLYHTENGSQRRHLVPSRLKNIAQTTEILEQELEDELRKEMNLQMFEEIAKESIKQVSESPLNHYPSRGVRCASEEPRFKTNMQFKLSTDEIIKNQKTPTTQAKVSIRRFSLAVPGENVPPPTESSTPTGFPRNKLNITPLQMKPMYAAPISRRAQFTVRSNSIQGIQSMPEHGHEKQLIIRNDQVAPVPFQSQTSTEKSVTPQMTSGAEGTIGKLAGLKTPRIISTSTKRQVMPAVRTRSNSLSVLSTARAPPASKFIRPTNFSLSTGSKTSPITATLLTKEIITNGSATQSGQSVKLKTEEQTVNHDIIEAPPEFQDGPTETREPNTVSQNSNGRRPSFTSQSRALNPLPMVRMPSNVVKIENKSREISAPSSSRTSSAPIKKETTSLVSTPTNRYTFFKTPENTFRTSYRQKESYEIKATSQPGATPANYCTPDRVRIEMTQQQIGQNYGNLDMKAPSGSKYSSQSQSSCNFIQPSNRFQQRSSYSTVQTVQPIQNPLRYQSSTINSSTSPHLLPNARFTYAPQTFQPSTFNSYQSQTRAPPYSTSNLSNTSQTQSSYYSPGTSNLSQTLSSPNRQLLTNFAVGSRGQSWLSGRDRIEPSSHALPVYRDRSNQFSSPIAQNHQSTRSPQDRSSFMQSTNQYSTYSTLPRSFKASGHSLFGTGSSFTSSPQNTWQPGPSRISSTDSKHWDHSKTN